MIGSVLGVGAPGHRGVPVAARQILERRLDAPQILPDQLKAVARRSTSPVSMMSWVASQCT